MPHLEPIWNDWWDIQTYGSGIDFDIASRPQKWREAMRLLTKLKASVELGAQASVKKFLG